LIIFVEFFNGSVISLFAGFGKEASGYFSASAVIGNAFAALTVART